MHDEISWLSVVNRSLQLEASFSPSSARCGGLFDRRFAADSSDRDCPDLF
jgi:hypothetical protein